MRAALVLPAAGRGTRFGDGDLPKQLRPVAGVPMLRRSLLRFAGLVERAVIPVAPDLRAATEAAIGRSALEFPVELVPGGATRQRSVHNGLRSVPVHCDAVLVHDAARPLVPRRCIVACLAALSDHHASLVANPCHPTVKRARPDAPLVLETIPREGLWLAQTPQGLRRETALAVFDRATAEGREYSDDVGPCEAAGLPVAIVPGDPVNFKITTPSDLALAEAILRGGWEEDGTTGA